MEKHHIDHGVMLNLSQVYCNGWARQDAKDAIEWQNDFNARYVRMIAACIDTFIHWNY